MWQIKRLKRYIDLSVIFLKDNFPAALAKIKALRHSKNNRPAFFFFSEQGLAKVQNLTVTQDERLVQVNHVAHPCVKCLHRCVLKRNTLLKKKTLSQLRFK